MLVRLNLTSATDFVGLGADSFAQGFTFSREALTLLFLIPAFLGVAIYMVPLQIGAPNLAFPRAATASFWAWQVSAVVLIGAYLGNGGPYGGWANGVDLHLLALSGLVVSLLLGCIGRTIILDHERGLPKINRLLAIAMDKVRLFSTVQILKFGRPLNSDRIRILRIR